MIAIDGMTIARSTNFGREAYRVLWYLTAQLDFASFTAVNTGEISIDLDMKSQAVSRALGALTRGGIIERGPRIGQKSSFRFSRRVAAPTPGSEWQSVKLPGQASAPDRRQELSCPGIAGGSNS